MKMTDKMIRAIASKVIYSRGLNYFKSKRAHLKQCTDSEINAVVDGEHLYNVQIKFDEKQINYIFCSCPYFSTMDCACKHIVAAAKQYQADFAENGADSDAEAAAELCEMYEMYGMHKMYKKDTADNILPLQLRVNITTPKYKGDRGRYNLQITHKILDRNIDVAKFARSYIQNTEMKLGHTLIYSPKRHTFTEHDRKILDFIAKIVDNNDVAYSSVYSMPSFYLSVGAYGIKELLDIEDISFELYIDGAAYPDAKRYYENPDILVDITASENGINMSSADMGKALVPGGEWFLFEGDLYRTDNEFRRWYMPIYTAMRGKYKNQITFRKESAVRFVKNVLPGIRNRHGVTESGLEEIIVDSEPVFSLYLDAADSGIRAAVKVSYGDISFILPDGEFDENKILLRDNGREEYIMSYFSRFSRSGRYYILDDDDLIYKFITKTLPELAEDIPVYFSDAFNKIYPLNGTGVSARPSLSIKAAYNSDTDLLEMNFETDLDDDEIIAILSAIREKKKYYRMKSGYFLDIENNNELGIFEMMSNIGFDKKDISDRSKKLSKNNMIYISQIEGIQLGPEFNEMFEKFRNVRAEIPETLTGVLRDYQKTGVNWLAQLSAFSFGGILADDMGLGKTLQVIAFVSSQKCEYPTLIAAPSSLTYNWQNEINKFMPDKTLIIIDGNKSERIYRLQEYAEYDFVITSYALLRRDAEEYEKLKFEYCFIDEAQHIKNPKTKISESMKKINAKHKFALTGTPIENSLTELWSIFDFIMPGYLYSHSEFQEKFERPAARGSAAAVKHLKSKISPFLLRRMKKDVLNELPEKHETVIYSELTKAQKDMYAAHMALVKNKITEIENKVEILAMLTRLKEICDHPALFDESYKKDSGKLLLLEELLEDALSSGHRVIIFSQFTSMLDIIKKRLEAMKITSFYLSGNTPADKRADMADKFNSGERDVFLSSLKAGGTGLNLIGADTVIHYDLWWNPASTEQASDRAYRIGQTKDVHIIKLISKGTIEEKILQLQEKKKVLADDIITTQNVNIGSLTRDELLAILN